MAGEAGSLSRRRGAEADPQEEEADEDEEARFFDSYGDEVQDDHSPAADHQVESFGDRADEDDFDERERERAAAEENRLERQAEEIAAQEEIRKREEELAREREAAEEREREREREAERVRQIEEQEELERAEQTRKAQEEMRLLVERDKLEKKLREEEEARQREVAKRQLFEQRKQDLADKRDAGQVMLQGEVSVQGGRSMVSVCVFRLMRDQLIARIFFLAVATEVLRAERLRDLVLQGSRCEFSNLSDRPSIRPADDSGIESSFSKSGSRETARHRPDVHNRLHRRSSR